MTTVTSSQTKNKIPDGPKNPAFVQTIMGLLRPFELLEANSKKYGDIYSTKTLEFGQTIVLSNPKAIEQLFKADPNLFEIGKNNWPLRPLAGDNTLILLDGEEHQRKRKMLMPPFHGERMKSYGKIIVDLTNKVIENWEINKPFIVRKSTQEISLRVILKAVFGLESGEKYDRIVQLLSSWLDIFNSPFKSIFIVLPFLQKDLGNLTFWGKFLQQRKLIDEILMAEINERRKQNNFGEDILSLLLSARDEEGESMSDRELLNELRSIVLAGHETTASALAWAFYWVHYLPEVRQKIIAELNSQDKNADAIAISKLPFLSAVVAETLRIYPISISTMPRKLKVPFEIMGYKFEPGTTLFPSIYLIHHREDIYPDPKKFKPERFLEKQRLGERSLASCGVAVAWGLPRRLYATSDAGSHRFSPYEYLPFGGGNRRCLGYAFALFEMKLVLATVLSEVELELLDRKPLKPVLRGVAFTPSGGVKMAVKTSSK